MKASVDGVEGGTPTVRARVDGREGGTPSVRASVGGRMGGRRGSGRAVRLSYKWAAEKIWTRWGEGQVRSIRRVGKQYKSVSEKRVNL